MTGKTDVLTISENDEKESVDLWSPFFVFIGKERKAGESLVGRKMAMNGETGTGKWAEKVWRARKKIQAGKRAKLVRKEGGGWLGGRGCGARWQCGG